MLEPHLRTKPGARHPLLVDLVRPRLLEIQISVRARLELANEQGWFGEVEALELNLQHIREKLEQVQRTQARQPQVSVELLGSPAGSPD